MHGAFFTRPQCKSSTRVARPWKLEQNTSRQASRQASRASRLWKLEQNNMTKKGPFFGPQNVRKSRRAKMGVPSTDNDLARCVPTIPTVKPCLVPIVTPSAYQLPSACRYPSTQGPEMLSSWLSARGILPTTPHQ